MHELGVAEPEKHFVIVQEDDERIEEWGAQNTVLIKKTPFTDEELAGVRQAMEEYNLSAVYLPDQPIPNAFSEFLLSSDPMAFAAAYPYDISPTTDDRPFFFYTWRASQLWDIAVSRYSADSKINLGVMLLFVSLGFAIFGTAVILILPIWLLKQHIPRERPVWFHMCYFLSIGLGFILVEIAFVQRIALYLGQPTYALTVVIFSLLLSSGVGSYMSRRVINGEERRLNILLFAIAMVTAVLIAITPTVLDASLTLPLAAKLALVVLLLSPLGFLMGMPFPSGLTRLEKPFPQAVCWAWAVNAAASVLGSVGAIFLAIHIGLAQTMLLGGCCYLGALAAVLLTARSQARQDEVAISQSPAGASEAYGD